MTTGIPHYVNSGTLPTARHPRSSTRAGFCVFAICLGLLATPAVAAVTCTVSATATDFGVYNPITATPDDTTGTVTASCTLVSGGATTVNIVSSYSTGSSGTFGSRTMQSGANKINYNLYFDAAFTQIRGDGSGGSQTGGATFNLTTSNRTQSTTSTIYGRAPASQDVAAGSYSDIVTVTITY